MNLKNYTTTVPGQQSIGEIEGFLSMFGASAIMKELAGDGRTKSIAFKLDEQSYKLPVNAEGVYAILFAEVKPAKGRDGMKHREDQAYRVAWRILRDWLHAQLSMMVSQQAKPDEIMLPYLWNGEKTLYEAYREGSFKIEDKRERR